MYPLILLILILCQLTICFFFADFHILVSDSPVCLQNCLDFIGKYFSDWKLCINMEKTDVLILMVKQLVKFCTDFIKTLNTK